MAGFHFFVVCLALLAGSTSASWGRRGGSTLPAGARLGDTCEPSGTRSRCGERTLLNSTETPLTAADGVTGPNVCRVTSMYMQQTCGYTYQQYCSRYFRNQFCQTGCFVTNECNGTMVNFTKTTTECCDGFAQEDSAETESSLWYIDYFYFFRNHRGSTSLRTNGCPIMLQDSVLDCLAELNAGEFLSEISRVPAVLERLGDSESDPVTVFAPSSDAFANLDDITREFYFGDFARETSVSAHIGEGKFLTNKLNYRRLISTLATNVSVHIGKSSNRTVKMYYVNGVLISQTTACQARNGIVHIIDDVVPFSSATITDILNEQSSRFSTFQQLAQAAGTGLDVQQTSRTLFAPVNEAFNANLVECLLREENECYLRDFVLIHVSYSAEYTATLSQRSRVLTLTPRCRYLTIGSNGNQVTVTTDTTEDEIAITDPDIPANNGVIHTIENFIQPFSNTKLERICPGITATVAPTVGTTGVNIIDPEGTSDPDGIPPGGPVVDPDPIE